MSSDSIAEAQADIEAIQRQLSAVGLVLAGLYFALSDEAETLGRESRIKAEQSKAERHIRRQARKTTSHKAR